MDTGATPTTVSPLLVATIVKNYLGHNPLSAADIAILITTVHLALQQVGTPPDPTGPARSPAVPIRRSIHRDYLICLECGRRAKTMRRHLDTSHGLTPEQYRARWGLQKDYPISAPAYAEARSAMAKQIGLIWVAVASQPRCRRQNLGELVVADDRSSGSTRHSSFVTSPPQTRRRRAKNDEPVAGAVATRYDRPHEIS